MSTGRPGAAENRGVWLVVLVLLAGVGMTIGWLRTGHASAPDDGLQQIDMLTLHERVAGVEAVAGQPTLVAFAGRCDHADERRPLLASRYGLVVHRPADPGYTGLADRLALPEAERSCRPGYVLVDAAGFIRYRTYDAGWPVHADEQQILLDAL